MQDLYWTSALVDALERKKIRHHESNTHHLTSENTNNDFMLGITYGPCITKMLSQTFQLPLVTSFTTAGAYINQADKRLILKYRETSSYKFWIVRSFWYLTGVSAALLR